ncbi:hydrogenase maturation protease [Desulfoplanes formicivorans]|uniref:Hydrogenase maturation protease n=1 Tax=Desulfoplanes formicivorans TaxID=1592317 RepID=A0A194AGY3_9BACT|nr:hydrogenase maturation protease [Desulfoplanes formicivorans]GAU08588.1 hydrogenase maturation protease [Desulfoplanes formicivorans]
MKMDDGSGAAQQAGTVVVGIGNPLLKDDRAGLEVVERIGALNRDVDVEILYTVGFEILDKVLGYERAFIVDGCQLGNEPGTVLDLAVDDIFTDQALIGSHATTLGGTLKAGYELFAQEMPRDLRIILIEVEDAMTFANHCTLVVQRAVDKVVNQIMQTLAEKPLSAVS